MFSLHPPCVFICITFPFPLTPKHRRASRAWMFFQTQSPTETPSLDAQLSVSLSPSPTQLLAPRTQNRQEKPENEEKEQEDEGDQTVSVPCYEIHATGLRRCSEPLTFNLPPPGVQPPTQTLSHLVVSSEQRFLSCHVLLSP